MRGLILFAAIGGRTKLTRIGDLWKVHLCRDRLPKFQGKPFCLFYATRVYRNWLIRAKTRFSAQNKMFTCSAMESSWTQKRAAILADHKHNPHLSARKLGVRHKSHHSTVTKYISELEQGVVGKQPGRPTSLSSSQVKDVVKMALAQKSASSVKIACSMKAQGVDVSPQTVNRCLRDNGVVCGYPKNVPHLSHRNKGRREQWSSKLLNSRRSFSGWMFTDSKYFLLNNTGSKKGQKVYYPKGKRPTRSSLSHSRGVHFYLGVTKFGATEPVLATGGGGKTPSYSKPNGKGLYPGVCAEEYRTEIVPKLVAGGNRLFAPHSKWVGRWVFQQDNAPIHKSKATLEKIVELMDGNEGRVEMQWPAMSPDLSWIENVWAWAENELDRRRDGIETMAELENEVRSILRRVPLDFMQKLVAGMKGRLIEVGKRGGGHIGK